MTAEEKWFRRLKRCLDDMPDGINIIVHHGRMQMVFKQDKLDYFDGMGDIDNVPEIVGFSTNGVIPCSESL